MGKPILKKSGKPLNRSNGKNTKLRGVKKAFLIGFFKKNITTFVSKKMSSYRYNTETSLKDVILAIFKRYRLNYGIDKVRVKEAWVEVVGAPIVKFTVSVRLQGSKLYVTLNNTALREDLNYGKSKLVTLLNEYLQKEVVKDIVFLVA